MRQVESSKPLPGQLSFFHPATFRETKPFPCNSCGFDKKLCCTYPDTADDFCVRGSKWRPRKEIAIP